MRVVLTTHEIDAIHLISMCARAREIERGNIPPPANPDRSEGSIQVGLRLIDLPPASVGVNSFLELARRGGESRVALVGRWFEFATLDCSADLRLPPLSLLSGWYGWARCCLVRSPLP